MCKSSKLPCILILIAAAGVCGTVFSSCTLTSSVTGARYALVYGIRDYPGTSADLSYTVKDAESIEGLLESRGVDSANMIEREDSSVTKAQIKADILSFASVDSNSTVIFYYSGHGSYVDSSWGSYYPTYSGGYICSYDSVGTSGYIESSTIENLISPSELEIWLSQMGTKNVIVILDSCYSGNFVSSESATDTSPADDSDNPSYSAFSTAMSNFGSLLVSNASASGQKTPIVISACGSAEESYDGTTAMAHGVFTYFLLKAASSGDSNDDGYLTTTEAYSYTAKAINSWFSPQLLRAGYSYFLPHISGDTRDLVLFSK
jgi:uncharacterized caspase-like protein